MDSFIEKLEKLLQYLSEIEEGKTAYIGLAERLVEELGIGSDRLEQLVKEAIRKNLSNYLEKIREGEDKQPYIQLIGALAHEHGLDKAKIEKEIKGAIKEGDLKSLGCYIGMIQEGNLHLIPRAKEIERKYKAKSSLEEAVKEGELTYLLNNIRRIRQVPHFNPFLLGEGKILRNLARKYGYQEELREALKHYERRQEG